MSEGSLSISIRHSVRRHMNSQSQDIRSLPRVSLYKCNISISYHRNESRDTVRTGLISTQQTQQILKSHELRRQACRTAPNNSYQGARQFYARYRIDDPFSHPRSSDVARAMQMTSLWIQCSYHLPIGILRTKQREDTHTIVHYIDALSGKSARSEAHLPSEFRFAFDPNRWLSDFVGLEFGARGSGRNW